MFDCNNENPIISIDDACDQLQIGKSGLYQLLRTKQLKAFKIGRNWKIPTTSIKEYIQNQCNL